MKEKVLLIKKEVSKVIIGKDNVIEKILTAILAGGHILLEDIPGVGKTTMALAFSKAMGMKFNRVQFTPDVVPSDITGFSMYDSINKKFIYHSGAVMCNFFLADEINRTSSKTQSALLEVMQEGRVTVDGKTYEIPSPFVVVATQNPIGTAGTQKLPEAQLDRFMVKLSLGYPDFEAQINILKDRRETDPLDKVKEVITKEEVETVKEEIKKIYVDDKIYSYITILTEATRRHPYIKLGLSPRGALALCSMAKAGAFLAGRDYVVPDDVSKIFADICRHRLMIHSRSVMEEVDADTICSEILDMNKAPKQA